MCAGLRPLTFQDRPSGELRETWRFLLDGAGTGRPLLARWIGATLPRPLATALGAPTGRGVLRLGRVAGRAGAWLPAVWRYTSAGQGRGA